MAKAKGPSPCEMVWADRSERPVSNDVMDTSTPSICETKPSTSEINPETNNVSQSPTTARYFVLKLKEGSFENKSPFLISKGIKSVIGDAKSIKKLKSGDIMVEVNTAAQAASLLKCTSLANLEVSVTMHRTLNFSRGVISERDLQYISETEILENLREQNICEVRRINIKREGKPFPTQHLILTFQTPSIPSYITAGYLRCSVRPYIPNPLRCFLCQRFGHSRLSCRGSATCGRCAVVGHDSVNCEEPHRCVNCKGEHPSYSRSCPVWEVEKEVQALKFKNNISYPEARKIVKSRTPKVGISYAAALTPKPSISVGTQTDCNTITSRTMPVILSKSSNTARKLSSSTSNNLQRSESESVKPTPKKVRTGNQPEVSRANTFLKIRKPPGLRAKHKNPKYQTSGLRARHKNPKYQTSEKNEDSAKNFFAYDLSDDDSNMQDTENEDTQISPTPTPNDSRSGDDQRWSYNPSSFLYST